MIKGRSKRRREIADYDNKDTTFFVDQDKPLKFEDLGLELPETAPTQVVSIRLPSQLLNELKPMGSQQDVPYQALIKIFLREALSRAKKRSA
jgi:predicted DNA binding CopG/RHH family protein